ncbi:S-adenosyl-L-methionine-dependent methyltransferase [Rhizopogon salebrosus TDB-379]|nr:S-adenosyl-L-methionine-dependent methyltransferase [Rhizopogon salebrosus TDB-379]
MTDPNEVKLEALLEIINTSARQAIAEYKKTGHGVPSTDSTTFHPLDLATDTLGLRMAIRSLEGAYQQLSAILAPPQNTVSSFAHNCIWACTDVALRARFADVLDQHPRGLIVDKLADTVNLDKTNVARILRSLSLMGCFKEVERDVFANNRLSLILKSTNHTGCKIRFGSNVLLKCSAVLYEAMTDPEFARSHETDKAPRVLAFRKDGMKDNFWNMVRDDAETNDLFYKSMIGQSEVSGSLAVLHHYPWGNVSSMVDVGSGICAVSIPLAKMFPSLRITNQDLSDVITMAQKEWEKNAPETVLDGRVEFVPLNFLEEIPVPGKDIYYLRNILHDWPDAEATTILCNIREAMGPNSRVLVHECAFSHAFQQSVGECSGLTIAPEPLPPNFGAGSRRAYTQDMSMWFSFNSKERTLNELKVIGAAAGLAFNRVYDLVETMVMEFSVA